VHGRVHSVYILLFICEFVYVLVCIVVWFYWGKFPFNLYATGIMLREILAGVLPAHPARM